MSSFRDAAARALLTERGRTNRIAVFPFVHTSFAGELQGGAMHFSSSKFSFTAVCFIVLFLALPAVAQVRIFRGKVTDDKNQPIAKATVIIQGIDVKSRTFTIKTDKKGTFFYMGLPDGLYHVAARAQGFSPSYQTNIKATVQEERVIDLQLKPGPDQKLPFEMTSEEYENLKAESEKTQKRTEASAQVQALFDEGGKLAEAGKHSEAIEAFQKALALDPQQANILGKHGGVLPESRQAG